MPTKITIVADGSQAKDEIGSVAGAFDEIGKSAGSAASQTTAAASTIEKQLDDVDAKAKEAGQSVAGVGGGEGIASKITAASTAFLAIGRALQTVGHLARDAWNGIEFLAENGDPAANRLRESLDGVLRSLQTLSRDPAIQEVGNQLAAMGDVAVSGIKRVPDAFRESLGQIAEQMLVFGEQWNLVTEGSVEALAKIREQEQEALEVRRQHVKAAEEQLLLDRQREALSKSLKEFDSFRAAEARQAALNRISDEGEIVKMMDAQRARLERLASLGKLDDDRRAEGMRKLIEMQSRLREIQQETEQNEKQAAQRAADEAKRRKDEIDKQTQAMREQEREAEQAANAERERAQQELIEKQQKALADAGAAAALNQKASDPREVAKRLAQQRADAARNELYQSGETDDRKIEQAAEAARRQAFRQARNQAMGGRESFSQDEISGAIEQNAQSQIQQMSQTGRFSNTALQALSKSAEEQRRQSQELQSMQEQLQQIQQFQNGTEQDGERRRAQRGSNRQ